MFEIAFRDIQVSGKGVLRARSCYHTHLTAPPSLAAALCWYQQSRGLNNCRGAAWLQGAGNVALGPRI